MYVRRRAVILMRLRSGCRPLELRPRRHATRTRDVVSFLELSHAETPLSRSEEESSHTD